MTKLTIEEYIALSGFLASAKDKKDLEVNANRYTPEGLRRIKDAIRKIDKAVEPESSDSIPGGKE